MSKIEIRFNSESFNSEFVEESLKLISSFKYNEIIKIESPIQDIVFRDRNELLALFEGIRGSDINSLKIKFYEHNYIKWANANFYEQQAFKTIVLIYHWLELSMANPNDLDIKTNLFNEFIVDWNYTPGNQNTIYLIAENYNKDPETVKLLDKLVKVNLLSKLTVEINNYSYSNYFIPLLTPGVPLEFFKSSFDINGINTNKLWKNLLRDREIRVKNWFNNRF